ncbi:MAG: V-type ATP synthase subunit I [Euryarchaeota archaeon]|nr:V-type ATP synthase subunit I [Euryarchaeota archaeon]
MLLPEPMSRILVIGAKKRLPDTIDLLYNLENVHVIDYQGDEEGFTLGAPLPEASEASRKLLKLRSAERYLEISSDSFEGKISESKIKSDLDDNIARIEEEVDLAIETKNAKQAKLSEAENRLSQLEPYRTIPLDIEMYWGYNNLRVLAGNIRSNPEQALKESLNGYYEIFTSKDGSFVVLFVSSKYTESAQRILSDSGFTEVPLPTGSGLPSIAAAELDKEIQNLKDELEFTSKEIGVLNEKYASMILSSDEYLSNIVEMAELPLRMGTSAYTFILEAWVPTSSYENVASAFSEKFGDAVYLELIENRGREEYHTDEYEIEMESGMTTVEAESISIKDDPPVRLEHGRNTGRFEFFTKLLSTPRYNEIDPTITIAIFFPMFFGLMVGDVGYAIPFLILGALGLRMCTTPEWRGIATMLFYGGIWSVFFGLFLYGDMMGIEFTHAAHAKNLVSGWETATWSSLLGIEIPHHLFTIPGINFDVNLGYATKLGSVQILLYGSLWVGIAHLITGLAIGFYNLTIRHGIKIAIMEKLSWILIMAGFACLLPVVIDVLVLENDAALSLTNMLLLAAIGLFVIGLLLALKGEGGKVLIDLPEVVSNVLSYTRLIAIGMSKAGMALAFNYISIGLIAGIGMENVEPTTDIVMLIAALAIFTVGHLMIFILAILSSGLHGIRLQYVELFKKFYEGGGVDFNPLKIRRKYTVEE